jgi:hypothetical protein
VGSGGTPHRYKIYQPNCVKRFLIHLIIYRLARPESKTVVSPALPRKVGMRVNGLKTSG